MTAERPRHTGPPSVTRVLTWIRSPAGGEADGSLGSGASVTSGRFPEEEREAPAGAVGRSGLGTHGGDTFGDPEGRPPWRSGGGPCLRGGCGGGPGPGLGRGRAARPGDCGGSSCAGLGSRARTRLAPVRAWAPEPPADSVPRKCLLRAPGTHSGEQAGGAAFLLGSGGGRAAFSTGGQACLTGDFANGNLKVMFEKDKKRKKNTSRVSRASASISAAAGGKRRPVLVF